MKRKAKAVPEVDSRRGAALVVAKGQFHCHRIEQILPTHPPHEGLDEILQRFSHHAKHDFAVLLGTIPDILLNKRFL